MRSDEMEDCGCTIENFIRKGEQDKPNDSICREERQYAVFLYNILRYYRKPGRRNEQAEKIFRACGISGKAEVTQVFYEATFMRDFFKRNQCSKKVTFNYSLMKYMKGDLKREECDNNDLKHNLGRYPIKTKFSDNEKEHAKKKYKIRCMMEAKPDIAVIYREDGKEYLLFVECKLNSNAAYYKSPNCEKRFEQREIQGEIAAFLCQYLNENCQKKIEVAKSMKEPDTGGQRGTYRSRLVRFVRSGKTEEMGAVLIYDLIDLNDRIFEEFG